MVTSVSSIGLIVYSILKMPIGSKDIIFSWCCINSFNQFQRNDIAMAISKFDQFDFLIDIVPREELKPAKRQVHIHPFKYNGTFHKATYSKVRIVHGL